MMNQQDNREQEKHTESLIDLELTTDQAEQAKAGTGRTTAPPVGEVSEVIVSKA